LEILDHLVWVNDFFVTPIIVSKTKGTISGLSLVLAGAVRLCLCHQWREEDVMSNLGTYCTWSACLQVTTTFSIVTEHWLSQTAVNILTNVSLHFDTVVGRITQSAIKVRFISPNISHLKTGRSV